LPDPLYPPDHHSYRLFIRVDRPLEIRIGALGLFTFPAGDYVYVGSAKGKGRLASRLQRHLSPHKKLRWHIDYLLAQPGVNILQVETSDRRECPWNQATAGRILVPGFGASDCRAGCGAHLKFLGHEAS